MDSTVVQGMSGAKSNATSIEDELFGSLNPSKTKSTFARLSKLASSKARPDTGEESPEDVLQKCFGFLGYTGKRRNKLEFTNRKKHCCNLGGNFFVAFDEPEMFLGCKDGAKVDLNVSAFPKTCFSNDTLDIGSSETALRGDSSVDDLYLSAMESIAMSDDAPLQQKLFRLTRKLFGVSQQTHKRAGEQVMMARASPRVRTAALVSEVCVRTVDTSTDGRIVCVLCIQSARSRKSSTPVREVDRKLYLATKALGPTDTLEDVEALLREGGNPKRAGSKKGHCAADVANHLGYAALIELFDTIPSRRGSSSEGSTSELDEDAPTHIINALSETLPAAISEGEARIDGSITLPVNQNSSDVLTVECWYLRAATETSSDEVALQRQFLRFDRNGDSNESAPKCELVGTVEVPLADITSENSKRFKLTPTTSAPSEFAPTVREVEFRIQIARDLTAMKSERRKRHRGLVRKVHTAACPAQPCDGDLRMAYDGKKIDILRPLFDLHAQYSSMSAVEQAIDELCCIVELHAEIGVAPSLLNRCLSRVVQIQSGASIPWSDFLSTRDAGRLLGCVEAIVSSCVHLAGRPYQYFANDEKGIEELKSCVSVLVRAFSIDIWDACTAGEDDEEYDIMPIDVEEATVYQTEVIKAAADILGAQRSVNYMNLKNSLIDRFGVDEFNTYKSEIQKMCVEYDNKKSAKEARYGENRNTPSRPKTDATDDEIVERLQEILEDDREKIFMFNRIRSKLALEFDGTVIQRCRSRIGAAIVEEMEVRLATSDLTPREETHRSLRLELLFTLKHFCVEFYNRIKQKAGTTKDGPFNDFAVLIVTVNSAVGMLQSMGTAFASKYSEVKDLDIVTSLCRWLDSLVSADVKDIMNRWGSRSSETGFPVAFFELYKAIGNLWNFFEDQVPESVYFRFVLCRYHELFLPSVTDWLIQSKASALEMVNASIAKDTWNPVPGGGLVSSSCQDLMRTIYEITTFFSRISWPDRDEREGRLYVLMCDAVCTAGRVYCEKLVNNVNLPTAAEAESADLGDFYLDNDVCIRLNNVEEVAVKFADLYRFLQVAHVAESHRLKYSNEPNYRPHRALELFRSTHIAFQNHILSIGKKVAYLIGLRIELDLVGTFESFTGKDDPNIVANRALDGLLIERDDFRMNLSKQGQDRIALFASETLGKAVANRRVNGNARVGQKRDGYLRLNSYLMASKLGYQETILKLILCIWMRYTFILGSLLVRQVPTAETPTQTWLQLVLSLKNVMMQFLSDNGDGVSTAELMATANNILRPATECYQMSSQALVEYFYTAASAQQGGPIRERLKKSDADRLKDAFAFGDTLFDDSFTEEDQPDAYKEQDSAPPPSLVDLDYSRENGFAPYGKLRLRLIRFGDNSGGISVRVNVVSASRLPKAGSTYVTAWVVPDYVAGTSSISFKTQIQRTPFNPTYDEGFTVTDCTHGVAIQLRVMKRAEISLAFGSLFAPDEMLGSVLLDLHLVSKLEGEAALEFALRPQVYKGHLGQVQRLFETRSEGLKDQIARICFKALQ